MIKHSGFEALKHSLTHTPLRSQFILRVFEFKWSGFDAHKTPSDPQAFHISILWALSAWQLVPLHLLAVSSTSLSTRRPSAWFVFDDIKVHRKRVCLAVAALASLHFPKRGAGNAVVAPASLHSQCGDLHGECRLRNDLCKDAMLAFYASAAVASYLPSGA